ncbi:hypothetical protein NP493_161g02032 [Ridgeia piscesae]|uniref:Uncharacterized protein n=1 Tax=Ridgeia piscesae TaxID=27915 RepID=A0AAD9UFL6_RIDPI|nr:hypothetical protein NP493_161g02032 [Ridgeia piscesae]
MAATSRGTDEQQFVNIFVGAETGLLKGVNVAKKTWRNLNEVEAASREREIVSLCWADSQQTQVCMGLRDRTVQVYDTQKSQFTESHSFLGGEGVFKGLYRQDNVFISCTESGLLSVWDADDVRTEINVGPQIHRMRQNQQQPHLVATGGKDNDLKIWDLQSGTTEPVFKAKNVKNDWLNLMVPIWVTDVAFLPDSDKIVTCTGHHQIRVYDPKSGQRRPVLDMEFDEYPFTSMGLRFGGNEVVVGNTHGKMALMDLRGKGHMVHCYRGFAGSIRCVECHPTLPLVASCGLDRYVRIHDLEEQTSGEQGNHQGPRSSLFHLFK